MTRSEGRRRVVAARTAAIVAAALASACRPAEEAAPPAAESRIELADAWVTPTRGAVRVNAGYLTIKNAGAAPDRLVSASSPDARAVEIHRHRMEQGIARMEEVREGVPLPAGHEAVFRPGGHHLMIFEPRAPLRPGQTLALTLVFQRAGRVQLRAPVEDSPPETADSHQDH